MLCQAPPYKNIFAYGERTVPQAMAYPGSALTIVLIAVFVAALALGLILMLVAKKQTTKSGEEKEPPDVPPPTDTTFISEEPRTRLDTQPSPAATGVISVESRPLPSARRYGLQAIIDIIGEGIEITLTGIAGCIVFIFDGFTILFKRIFRIDR